jgi:hypothetical protein
MLWPEQCDLLRSRDDANASRPGFSFADDARVLIASGYDLAQHILYSLWGD